MSFKEKKELEALPALIEELEKEKESCNNTMSKPDFYKRAKHEVAATSARLQEIEQNLKRAYARWETLDGIAR